MISKQGTNFLHSVFERDAAQRKTAKECVEAIQEESADAWGSKSLRPMLHSAKRVGAFDTRRVKENENDVDAMVRTWQRKIHGDEPEHRASSSSDGQRKDDSPSRRREAAPDENSPSRRQPPDDPKRKGSPLNSQVSSGT